MINHDILAPETIEANIEAEIKRVCEVSGLDHETLEPELRLDILERFRAEWKNDPTTNLAKQMYMLRISSMIMKTKTDILLDRLPKY